jgi:hypothetical protein
MIISGISQCSLVDAETMVRIEIPKVYNMYSFTAERVSSQINYADLYYIRLGED